MSNWSEYRDALFRHGEIDIWLSEEALYLWNKKDSIYDGTGAPKFFSDFAMTTCYEIRQIYRLLLRQIEGFIKTLFQMMAIPLVCPDFNYLSKRLDKLGIKVPKYKKESHIKKMCAP